MPRTAAKFTQADFERLIRAAKKEGSRSAAVTMPDGTKFEIDLTQSTDDQQPGTPKREVVL
jgi:hypothetical protein